MISDMERIGDQAYDIAEITKTIENEAGSFCQEHISAMAPDCDTDGDGKYRFIRKKDIGIAKKCYNQ